VLEEKDNQELHQHQLTGKPFGGNLPVDKLDALFGK